MPLVGPGFQDFRIGERLLQCAVEGIDDRLRRAGRRKHDLPEVDVELRAIGRDEARHAGELRRGVLRGDAEHLHRAGGELPDHLLRRREEQVDVAAERVLQHRGCAAIGNVGDLDAERLRQQRGREMAGGADAGMAHARGLGLHPGDQLGQRLGLEVLPPDQHQRVGVDHGDRQEVLLGVERQRLVERDVRGDLQVVDEQRVAVGRRARDALARDVGAAAARRSRPRSSGRASPPSSGATCRAT